ncbi:hypothetical protein M3685_12945 [Heyndrickxia oleronia]|uniref:hypothetical protein n=1 Tax=Heyndrickxia oleronia TaxID=38875 RepID=UPI0015D2F1F7|nr:hypothetical protein [Heyndrickxia oleronia]MCM3454827.1 hypothetical protein [Heyndrickxia oleronia]NYV66614.1 hypothetical protein [Bacillus sp. Gen3]
MKIGKLDQQKLGRVLIQASMTALYQKNETLLETMLSFEPDSENKTEWKFVKDLFTLTTDEIAEQWYGGKDNSIGFIFKE